MDRGARQATVHGVTKEWDMTYQLNNYDTLWLLLSITVAIGNKNSLLHTNLYELCLEDLKKKKKKVGESFSISTSYLSFKPKQLRKLGE